MPIGKRLRHALHETPATQAWSDDHPLPDGVSIRPTTLDDLLGVEHVLEPMVKARRLLPRTHEELSKLLPTGFVAVVGNDIIGFAAVEIYSKKLAEIQALGVTLPWRGRGLGKKLVLECVQLARDQGVYELMAITASESLFVDCGFHYSLPDQKKALFIQLYDKH